MYPLQIFQIKLPCLYLIMSINGSILSFENRGLVCSYLFLKEISLIAAFTFSSIPLMLDGCVDVQLSKL